MEPELKIYTITDLRLWLIDNNPPVGLSEQVIAPMRAYAILNNPYVQDQDAVVAAIYVGDELVAFSATFPDMFNDIRIWWCTTLWCDSKYQGKGFGMIVVGSLQEMHEGELFCDRWGIKETVEIFKSIGAKNTYTHRYWLSDKKINHNTIKGCLAYWVQKVEKKLHQKSLPHMSYTLKYSGFIDGEAYAFMKSHQCDDLILREQKMLNWILQYPFSQVCLLPERVEYDCVFTSNVEQYQYCVVKVYTQGRLVGVYVLRLRNNVLSVLYLYVENTYAHLVYHSVAEHIVKTNVVSFCTECKDLLDYIQQHIYFPKCYSEQVSLSLPQSVNLPPEFTMQMGDGDSFA